MAVDAIGLTPIFPRTVEVGTFEIPDFAGVVNEIVSSYPLQDLLGVTFVALPPTTTTCGVNADTVNIGNRLCDNKGPVSGIRVRGVWYGRVSRGRFAKAILP